MKHQNIRPLAYTSKMVAVVVPLSNRTDFTPEEEISLRHLMHFLGRYDKYFVIPKSLQFEYPGFGLKRFNDRFFGSTAAHKKLMFSPRFYKAFREYRYMLIYHLDALVFSDQLMEWCQTDLDYIGAPWIQCEDAPWIQEPRVGNGGFSLRKIESFLKVLYSSEYWVEPTKYWRDLCVAKPKYFQFMNFPKKYIKRLKTFNGVRRHMACYPWNDDDFISQYATKYYSKFRIASFEFGLRFAFEVDPRRCFELNNRTLPFGCHAWHRYDRDFWEPYLLKEILIDKGRDSHLPSEGAG